ncbi:NADAR family protein [Streptomyces sp. NRRL F-5630]|uniref:NADAR family protein n=1 Tax=Streptomyces sp. NRRL F-5630 TaxID=1463864 RepID=UPI003EC13B35
MEEESSRDYVALLERARGTVLPVARGGDGETPEDDAARADVPGRRVEFLHFWGHTSRGGDLGKACLSQWWPAPFTVGAATYATAEHWMMARKARLFGDVAAENAALAAPGPAQAKAAGRLVQGFDEATWERERFGIVVEGSVHKFSAHPALTDFLLGTGNRVLVEASPLDRIWGIGLAADDPRASRPASWPGQNLLGFALMAARDILRGEA